MLAQLWPKLVVSVINMCRHVFKPGQLQSKCTGHRMETTSCVEVAMLEPFCSRHFAMCIPRSGRDLLVLRATCRPLSRAIRSALSVYASDMPSGRFSGAAWALLGRRRALLRRIPRAPVVVRFASLLRRSGGPQMAGR